MKSYFVGALAVAFLMTSVPSCGDLGDGDGEDGGSGGASMGSGGAGGGKGGGTGDGGGAVRAESCPGERMTVGSEPVVVESTLGGREDDVQLFCVEEAQQGPDVVYAFEAARSGSLALELAGPSPSPTLFVTAGECGDLSRTRWCETARTLVVTDTPRSDAGLPAEAGTPREGGIPADAGTSPVDASSVLPDASADASEKPPDTAPPGSGGTVNVPAPPPIDGGTWLSTTAHVAVTQGEVVYAVVDGPRGSGRFSLRATLGEAKCGDRAVGPREDCDYGDELDGDGCSATCKFESPGDDDVCGADVRALLPASPIVIEGHNIGYIDQYEASSRSCTGVAPRGRDRVYGFFTDTAGVLEVTAEAEFDVVLYAMEACVNAKLTGVLACADSDRRTTAETISVTMPAGALYHVVVDGHGERDYGKFRLRVSFR